LLLETDYIEHLGLNGCRDLTDQCIMDMVNQCSKLTSIDLNGCRKVTDVGVPGLVTRSDQLQSIDIGRCGASILGAVAM
jgi:hypothetical protein